MARFLKRLCLVLAGTLLIGQAQAGAVQGKPCTYEDLMPEYEKFSLRTVTTSPGNRDFMQMHTTIARSCAAFMCQPANQPAVCVVGLWNP